MLNLKIREIKDIVNGTLINNAKEEKIINKVSIDSRTLAENDCFIALKGEKDGHLFIENALKKKAGLIIFSDSKFIKENEKIPFIKVNSTLKSLEDLAKYHRTKFSIPFVSITGSLGKTTTKELSSHILEANYKILKSQKSFNNHLGVPLTLLELNEKHEIAILEIGANNFGEISHLAELISPDIGIITCIAESHLEGFKNINGVKKAKAELLPKIKPNGIFITNKDDKNCMDIAKNFHGKVITFGIENKSDVKAHSVKSFIERLIFKIDSENFETKITGSHNIYNILASISLAKQFKVENDVIKKQLKTFNTPSMRMEIHKINDILILNDAYNSSPSSVLAAVNILSNLENRKIAIIGDMLELGDESQYLHRKIGKEITNLVDILLCIGEEVFYTYEEACKFNKNNKNIFHFFKLEDAIDWLLKNIEINDAILLKASRKMKFENLMEKLLHR